MIIGEYRLIHDQTIKEIKILRTDQSTDSSWEK